MTQLIPKLIRFLYEIRILWKMKKRILCFQICSIINQSSWPNQRAINFQLNKRLNRKQSKSNKDWSVAIKMKIRIYNTSCCPSLKWSIEIVNQKHLSMPRGILISWRMQEQYMALLFIHRSRSRICRYRSHLTISNLLICIKSNPIEKCMAILKYHKVK